MNICFSFVELHRKGTVRLHRRGNWTAGRSRRLRRTAQPDPSGQETNAYLNAALRIEGRIGPCTLLITTATPCRSQPRTAPTVQAMPTPGAQRDR
ncbi:hypothetical protein SAM23877_5882 [Streptomyces ambofaciens ATCC 23877]|uniref:Uncharacterized protein n=1 Tax=Streptomyces ambofaciens (strain ATCC 23877 / 3486 / DSM 40053 / JCM 4204 / NBRC 12836 / NRRL B-2516) TaxID=278992 RepID=A0A0K2B1E1_STRA7|nr:hypothetical protein SAM23877_5882 [Streptomyces ambofaciens ATCC 23877]